MKRLISSLLAVVIVLAAAVGAPLDASAESLYIRKVVSVVYDDSGSMEGDKWAYANYAMQAFCGMLNSEDRLFITYMSHTMRGSGYEPEEVDLSAGGIQDAVNSIRGHTSSSSTPYGAVEIAYEKLKSVDDSNPNTQYWLVVITDGAFDECVGMSYDRSREFLNENFESYAGSVMPNGVNPQITFLAIGDSVISPDENQSEGIYTYAAGSAGEITGAMNEMADKISGRTRLAQSDVRQTDDRTIQVSSSIPLLNIAVFSQGAEAKIAGAVYDNETDIPVTRQASLSYPGYSDLAGGAYLLGDSQNVIGSGTYSIAFDRAVDTEDIVVLFEPALEMRMAVSLNGREITNLDELDSAVEGDKVSVSCGIYEMGTEREIDWSLMPPGTRFELTVSEDGTVAEQISGEDMQLSEYVLKSVETEITASAIIEGFNPIEYAVDFTPGQYVPKVVYSITPEFGSDVKSIRFDDVASNEDLTICFTVHADGAALTDSAAVRALGPVISVSPEGNGGSVEYADDGRIIFTPNSASAPAASVGSYGVDVTCTIADGTTAAATYTVRMADYAVIPVDAAEPVKKTGFFGNEVGASFYITKDGERLGRAEVEDGIAVALNEAHAGLQTDISVAEDGTITVTPHDTEERALNFWNWWGNWWYYFRLPGEDVSVTLDHALGSAAATIDVTGETLQYQLLNVYLPLLLELTALTFLVIWIVLIITKPKFLKSAILYVAEISYNRESRTHILRSFGGVRLAKFNRIKRGNGRLKFKRTADVVSANGIRIRADHGGRIICEMEMLSPWYKGQVEPIDIDLTNLRTPADISDYFSNHRRLEIVEFTTTETIDGEHQRSLIPANPHRAKYIVIPDPDNGISVVDDRRVIRSGRIFVYING